MIGFIKNLIGGILGFFSGILGGKKKNNGYYLELKEDAEVKPIAAVKEAASKATKAVKAAADETAKKVEEKAVAVAEPAKKESAKTSKTSAKKAKNDAPTQNGKVAKAEPPVTPKDPNEATFAPKYLAPSGSSNGRRRPGANMNSFLDMARQVKTPG